MERTNTKYNDLKPFRFWCQKVLPLVYDDSLSYYELLDKVIDYLNKTMEDVTVLNDDTEALYTAYNQLQSYVNNYFDNLDVQDEINAKLDQMAIDGTLSSLINPQIPGAVSAWLAANVNPVGSAVIVDSTLTIAGAAADAQATGNALNGKEDILTFDNAPTAGSGNPVRSFGIKTYVDGSVANVVGEIADLRQDTEDEIDDLRGDVEDEIADLRQDTEDEIDDLRGDVEDEITDLKGDLTQTNERLSANNIAQQYEFEIGSIASADGQDMSRNDRIRCKPFYAMSGQIFSVSTEENILALYQYDYNGNYVRMVTDGSFLSTATAPENGIYRIVMKDASGSAIVESDIPSIVAKLLPSSVAFPGVRILQNEIDDIREDDINEIKDTMIFINNDEFTVHSNKYANYLTGKLSTYTGSQSIEFPVCQGLKFAYSYTKNSPDYMGLYFVDALGVYLTGYQAIAQAQTITVPENAVRCFATIANTSNIKFLNTGNAFLENVSEPNAIAGLAMSATPLETLTDNTGMLDIFLHVGCIGDSLASGESYWNDGGTPSAQDFYQYSWGQYLARKTGNTYYNWSSGGQSTRTWLQSSYATQCFDGQHLCEAYIIGLGQNDANYNYTIGSSADIDLTDYNNNADSFYGSYGKIIQKIKEVQPQAKIFVITDPNASTNSKGYNVAIRDMANIFTNVYVIDMREYALKYMKSPVLIAQSRYSHFNAYGYKLFAMMIANYIDWIVTTNYTEFTQVELIGTGHNWT